MTTTTLLDEPTCRTCGRLAGGLGTDGNGQCYECRTVGDARVADMLHEQCTFGPELAMCNLPDDERRTLRARIDATRQQIARIKRQHYDYGKHSERAMFYGIRKLESHIATLRWDLAAV